MTCLTYLLALCFLFIHFLITLPTHFFIFILLSEKDLVKQAKTLNSAANKLIPKHH